MGVIMTTKEAETQSLSDSDIWGNSDDEYKPNIAEDEFYGEKPDIAENSEISALRRIHAKQGYLEGLSSAKEESLQEGFDKGYPSGAQIGIAVGKILGKLQFISTISDLDPQVKSQARRLLTEAKNELMIQKVLNRKHFDDGLSLPDDNHLLVQRWEQTVNELTNGIGLQ